MLKIRNKLIGYLHTFAYEQLINWFDIVVLVRCVCLPWVQFSLLTQAEALKKCNESERTQTSDFLPGLVINERKFCFTVWNNLKCMCMCLQNRLVGHSLKLFSGICVSINKFINILSVSPKLISIFPLFTYPLISYWLNCPLFKK